MEKFEIGEIVNYNSDKISCRVQVEGYENSKVKIKFIDHADIIHYVNENNLHKRNNFEKLGFIRKEKF